mgnify:FL=1|jgi:hypothetical protein
MDTLIGIGNVGCNVVEKMSSYPQYNILKIDSDLREGDGVLKLEAMASHEEYENSFPQDEAEEFLKSVTGECMVVVSGASKISGIVLRILELLGRQPLYITKLSVLYIRPDLESLVGERRLHERLTFGVLQEYARSNLLERIYLVDNVKLEKSLGKISIADYYEQLNNLLQSTLHFINVFRHVDPVINTFSPPIPTAKISTFGMVDFNDGEESLFFDLKFPREKIYYYAINNERLQEDSSLFGKIRQQIKAKTDDKVDVSYGIYPTEYENDYVYCVYNATLVQGQNIL